MDSSHRSVGEETLSPVQFYKVFHLRFFFIREICTFNYGSIRHPTTACTIDIRLQHQMCNTVRFLL